MIVTSDEWVVTDGLLPHQLPSSDLSLRARVDYFRNAARGWFAAGCSERKHPSLRRRRRRMWHYRRRCSTTGGRGGAFPARAERGAAGASRSGDGAGAVLLPVAAFVPSG